MIRKVAFVVLLALMPGCDCMHNHDETCDIWYGTGTIRRGGDLPVVEAHGEMHYKIGYLGEEGETVRVVTRNCGIGNDGKKGAYLDFHIMPQDNVSP